MSGIGPIPIGGTNLAGSFAGAQRADANNDRNKADAAEQNLQVDRKSLESRSLGDVAESGESEDRDADGRLPWEVPPETDETTGEETTPPKTEARPGDPLGERGGSLDFEA